MTRARVVDGFGTCTICGASINDFAAHQSWHIHLEVLEQRIQAALDSAHSALLAVDE